MHWSIPYLTTPRARVFWRNVRLPQLFFLWLAGSVGLHVALSIGVPIRVDVSTGLHFLFLLTAIGLGWTASCVMNDAYDEVIDKISNAHRPIPQGLFTPREFLLAGKVAYGGAFLLSLTFGWRGFLAFSGFLLLNAVYNLPPLRLKRFPLIGTMVAAAAFQSLAYAGFFLFAPETAYPYSPFMVLLFVLALGLIIPIKDFKDIAGDQAGGVLTLPILLGPWWSRLVVLAGIIALACLALSTSGIEFGFTGMVIGGVGLGLAAVVLFGSHTRLWGITPQTLLFWMALPVLWQIVASILWLR